MNQSDLHCKQYFNLAWKTIYAIGILAAIWGALQILFRYSHPLLPEDVKFTGLTVDQLSKFNPQLLEWIGLVMRAWGAFIFSTGIFTVYLAKDGLRNHHRWALKALAVGGIPMFIVFLVGNILLRSQFLILIGFLFILFCSSLLIIWQGDTRS